MKLRAVTLFLFFFFLTNEDFENSIKNRGKNGSTSLCWAYDFANAFKEDRCFAISFQKLTFHCTCSCKLGDTLICHWSCATWDIVSTAERVLSCILLKRTCCFGVNSWFDFPPDSMCQFKKRIIPPSHPTNLETSDLAYNLLNCSV